MQEAGRYRFFGNINNPEYLVVVPLNFKEYDENDLPMLARNVALIIHNDPSPVMGEMMTLFPCIQCLTEPQTNTDDTKTFDTDKFAVAIMEANSDMKELLDSFKKQGKAMIMYTTTTLSYPQKDPDVIQDATRIFYGLLIILLLSLLFSKLLTSE